MQQSVESAIDGMQISNLVDVIRQNLNIGLAKMAINRIYEILHAEFPEYQYQRNFSFNDLELHLHKYSPNF
jgi:hypothetical protein